LASGFSLHHVAAGRAVNVARRTFPVVVDCMRRVTDDVAFIVVPEHLDAHPVATVPPCVGFRRHNQHVRRGTFTAASSVRKHARGGAFCL
jgi:hypothetical protein